MTRDDLLRAARDAVRETVPARAGAITPLLDLPPTGEMSADHATLAEATLVQAIETVLRHELGTDADPVLAAFQAKRGENRAYSAFLPRTGGDFERNEGKGTVATPLDEACPACQRTGTVHYTGSDVLDGSLETYYLIHTEVEDHFRCTACAHTWSEMRFL
jgi:hypothetical protein